jgi:CRP-like cAMP-binding protein
MNTCDTYRELWERQSRFLPRADGHLDPEALRHIRLFEGLDDASIQAISLLLATEHYPAFSEVLREGDANDKLYLIARGSVETFRTDDPSERYILSDGDHFGEIGLLERGPSTVTVQTRLPTTVLTLNGRTFLSIVAASPEIKTALERSAEERRVES